MLHLTSWYTIGGYQDILPLDVLKYFEADFEPYQVFMLNWFKYFDQKIRQFLSKNVSIPSDQNLSQGEKNVSIPRRQNVPVTPNCILLTYIFVLSLCFVYIFSLICVTFFRLFDLFFRNIVFFTNMYTVDWCLL